MQEKYNMQTLLRSIVPHVARKCCTLNIEKSFHIIFIVLPSASRLGFQKTNQGKIISNGQEYWLNAPIVGVKYMLQNASQKKTKISFVRASIRDCGCLTTILVKIVQYI